MREGRKKNKNKSRKYIDYDITNIIKKNHEYPEYAIF